MSDLIAAVRGFCVIWPSGRLATGEVRFEDGETFDEIRTGDLHNPDGHLVKKHPAMFGLDPKGRAA